uniref:Uncharacterized protein n=1 Tax=Avena sativa TaxID=4498 RepID=A0ACD5V914_AVESA
MASNSKQVLYMNPGQGETSYARNSSIQKSEQNRMKPFIEAAVVDICTRISTGKVLIADLGCSSGPNALALVSIAIEAIHDYCLQFQQTPPEVCVLLNDLPNNDFNSVVKRLDTLRQSSGHVASQLSNNYAEQGRYQENQEHYPDPSLASTELPGKHYHMLAYI